MSKTPITLYHNPRCSNSRRALTVLTKAGAPLKVVQYLETPPTPEEILEILEGLGEDAGDLVRTKEAAYAYSGLDEDSPNEVIAQALSQNPVLMQRPVCVRGDRVLIARPGSRAEELLTD